MPGEPFQRADDYARRRKKRLKTEQSALDVEERAFHDQVYGKLETAFAFLRIEDAPASNSRQVHWLPDSKPREGELNWPALLKQSSTVTTDRQIFDTLVLNTSNNDSETIDFATAGHESEIVLPPSGGFLMADYDRWSDHTGIIAEVGRQSGGWDVVLIDPPWPNRSAARSSSYDMFDPYKLWQLDLPGLLGDKSCIVAVWVTNRVKVCRKAHKHLQSIS